MVKLPAPTETDILRAIRTYLQLRGWFVIRHQAGLGSARGFPDLIAVKDGQVVFIEVKTPKGQLSSYQRAFWDELTAYGGSYVVLRSVKDAEELAQEFEGLAAPSKEGER